MRKNHNDMGYLSVQTENISAIFSKDELISMFRTPEDSTVPLPDYDLSNTVLITISDPHYEYIPEERLPVDYRICEKFSDFMRVKFWDVSTSDENYAVIDEAKALRLGSFIKENRGKKFIINCNAGISRSAGTGLLVEYICGEYEDLYHFKTSFKDVITEHYRYAPNLSVLDQYIKAIGV